MLLTLISFIIVISVLVFIHELGHFLVARACGVYVKDFSIGMGPVLYQYQGAETTYSIRALPIGGAVQMLGEDGVDKELADTDSQAAISPLQDTADQSDDPRSFINKPAWQRFLIIAAGPFMNFVLAIVIFFGIFSYQGFPTNQNVIGDVIAGTPAAQAGLMAEDTITRIDDQVIANWLDIKDALQRVPSGEVAIVIMRDQREMTVMVTPKLADDSNQRIIGIRAKTAFSLSQSLYYAFARTGQTAVTIVEFIPKLITGQIASNNVAGPIGIARISGDAAREGPLVFLSLMAFISINLGIMNLLPIPALDGGRILLIAVEIIFRRKIPAFIEEKIHLVGFALLMLLMLFVVFNDITNLIKG